MWAVYKSLNSCDITWRFIQASVSLVLSPTKLLLVIWNNFFLSTLMKRRILSQHHLQSIRMRSLYIIPVPHIFQQRNSILLLFIHHKSEVLLLCLFLSQTSGSSWILFWWGYRMIHLQELQFTKFWVELEVARWFLRFFSVFCVEF
jgi:hypothetical protein